MSIHRRHARLAPLLAVALCALPGTMLAATAAAPAPPTPTTAATPGPSQAGYYRLKVGQVDVTALSDGTLPTDIGLLQANGNVDIPRLLEKSFLKSPVDTSVNAFLLKSAGHLILVDTGAADLFGPTLNKLPGVLRSLGVAPTQITDILVTHIHTDHTGGLVQSGVRAFPNAVVHVERKEIAYWLDPANKAAARDDQKVLFDQAVLTIKPYVDAGQVAPFDGATQVLPGIRSLPAPGHTPGHTLYQLEDGGDKLVFWGDLVHVAAVQFPRPGVTIQYDVDPVQAAHTRRQFFADAARQGYLIAPAHVSFPGFGHVRRLGALASPPPGAAADAQGKGDGDGGDGEYRFYPVPYVNDATAP